MDTSNRVKTNDRDEEHSQNRSMEMDDDEQDDVVTTSKAKKAPPQSQRPSAQKQPPTTSSLSQPPQPQPQQQPTFAKVTGNKNSNNNKQQYRRIRCPPHRYTPLREHWEQILTPLVEYLKLQVRFNVKTRSVELKTSKHTLDGNASLQKGADFVSAFMLGFDVQDAVALLRLDDLYVESFEVTDVKSMLHGDHTSRAIGRLAGQDGKTRYAIEHATRTRIVIADTRIHILGSYANMKVARNAICDLILGAPPGKVYNNMRHVAKRMSERY